MTDETERTPDANEVFQAARDYFEAEREMHAALAKCEVSGGYYCRHEIEAAEKYGRKLADVFGRYVDARIRAILKESAND